MGDDINQSTIWKFVGRVSAITGMVCFGLSSTFDMSFGKLGYGGPLVYLLVCSFMRWLMILGKKIQVSEKFKGVVGAILFVVLCSISVVYDKYVPQKSDAYTIASYGSFALMSLSLSRKLELGFETGLSAFFLKLFASQLLKINWLLLPIALVFCSLVIVLRYYPEYRVIRVGDEESQYCQEQNLLPTNNQKNNEAESSQAAGQASQDMEGVSGQRQSTTSEDRNSQEEFSQAVREVSEKNTSDGDDDQIESSDSSEQRQVPRIMPTSETTQLRRRKATIEDKIPRAHHGQIRSTSPPPEHPSGGWKMTPAIQDKSDGAEQEEDSTSSLAASQYSLEQSLLPTNNQENNQGVSNESMNCSPSIGQVPERSVMSSESGNPQNGEEVLEQSKILHLNLNRQDSLEMGEVSGQRQLSTNKKQNIQEESSEAFRLNIPSSATQQHPRSQRPKKHQQDSDIKIMDPFRKI